MKSHNRERRLGRVDEQVLKRYRFERHDEGDLVRVAVTGGTAPYVVTASRTWSAGPACTCPDAQRPEVAGYCKHTLAVLTREPELSCQLLEVYL